MDGESEIARPAGESKVQRLPLLAADSSLTGFLSADPAV